MNKMRILSLGRLRLRSHLVPAVCLVFAQQLAVPSASADAARCLSASGETAVKLCESELTRNPGRIDVRLAMSDALVSLREYSKAVVILKDGLTRNPSSSQLKRKLALAQSYVEEESFLKQRRADAKIDSLTKRNIIRCKALTGESALEACNEALKWRYSDSSIYSAKGDALLEMERYVESSLAYRKALRLAPNDAEISAKLETAGSRRKNLASTCIDGTGATALSACDATLLIGEPDQFLIQKNKAELLLAMGRKQESIRAYREALELEPENKAVKDKIVVLTRPPKKAKVARKPAQSATPKTEKSLVKVVFKGDDRNTDAKPQVANLVKMERYSNAPRSAGVTH